KPGYFLGSRSFYPTSGTNLVDIKLLKKTKVGSFSATDGGSVNFESVSIDMGAGFVTESGTAYNGNVNVSGTYIDPTADDINEIMPGSMRAISPDGESLLASFGMMAVELTDDAGNPLQLGAGNTAEITSPIPAGLASTAPSTLPLWYFNEDKGYWIEEGEAKKIGNKYVGTVNHFSFWNCDIRIDAREANGIILHENGKPVAGVRITMKTDEAGTRGGNTCSEGKFKGLMPINVNITFSITGGPDKLSLYKFDRTIPSTGIIEPIVIPDTYFPKPISVTGTVVDCDNQPTDDVRLILNGRHVVETSEGVFNITLPSNSTHAVELRHKKEFKWQVLDILNVGSNTKDMGDLQYCPSTTPVVTLPLTEEVSFLKATYYIDGEKFEITNGIMVGEQDGKMALLMGDFKDKKGTFIQINMLSDFNFVGQKNFYTFNHASRLKWGIDVSTSLQKNQPLVPDNIRMDVLKWDLTPGGENTLIFFGTFNKYDQVTKDFVSGTISDGVIDFTMK
ncbi:MAG: hypothetical protein ACI8SE_002074, partial [Bacteroidia bacterium]